MANEQNKGQSKETQNKLREKLMKKSEKISKKSKDSAFERKAALLREDTPFHVREAYKVLRTNILFSIPKGEPCKKVVFTSAFPSEGKTINCANTAITFAQTGAKVLLIDGDMRKPQMHKLFGRKNEKGLSACLSGLESLEACIQHTDYENLDLITSGAIPPNPAELLSSQAMEELLGHAAEEYAFIFIDAPPVNVVTDATLLSSQVSGVVLLVREGMTDSRAVRDALSVLEFANAKVLGFVLNDVDTVKKQHHYHYRYKNNYHYDYDEGRKKTEA